MTRKFWGFKRTLGDDPTEISFSSDTIKFINKGDASFGREIVQHPTCRHNRMSMFRSAFNCLRNIINCVALFNRNVVLTSK